MISGDENFIVKFYRENTCVRFAKTTFLLDFLFFISFNNYIGLIFNFYVVDEYRSAKHCLAQSMAEIFADFVIRRLVIKKWQSLSII